jgi:hypothetical protein
VPLGSFFIALSLRRSDAEIRDFFNGLGLLDFGISSNVPCEKNLVHMLAPFFLLNRPIPMTGTVSAVKSF